MQEKIENLLNEIYRQPDLKGGVFEYMQAHVLKAYSLLKADELNVNEPQKILFTDGETKHRMETILFRDLPAVIDLYAKMPLEHRNEHKLKNGKTHRTQLLDNLELLTDSLTHLEKSAYEGLEQKMSVKTRVFKEIYHNSFANGVLEHDRESLKQTDNFTWIRPEASLDRTVNFDFFNKNDNKKIVLREEKIEYKVNDKFKHFMTGTYNTFNKFKAASVSGVKDLVDTMTNVLALDNPTKVDRGFSITIGLGMSMIVIVLGSVIMDEVQTKSNKAPVGHLINSVHKMNLDNEQLREASLKALEKYTTENHVNLVYSPNKDVATLSIETNSKECAIGVEKLQGNAISHYYLNDMEVKNTQRIDKDVVNELCKPAGNVIKLHMKVK